MQNRVGPTGMPQSTEALYWAALGPSGARAYLPLLARFEARGRSGPVWNLRPAVGNLAWLVYWRLWDAVLVQVSLTVVGAGALGWLWTGAADGVPMGVRAGLSAVMAGLCGALPGFWGLVWLQRGLRQRMAAAIEESDTFAEALERLERSESVWRVRGVVASAAVVLAVALLVGMALWAWSPSASGEPASAVPVPEPVPSVPPVRVAPVAVPVPAVAEVLPTAPVSLATETPAIRPRVRGFGVNVGMFAVEANAQRAKTLLTEAGLPVLDDPIESARGPLTRLRVGPFERREQAEAAASQVRALGLEARVYAP